METKCGNEKRKTTNSLPPCLLHGVVVEDADVHVIARRDEPLLPHDEPRAPDR